MAGDYYLLVITFYWVFSLHLVPQAEVDEARRLRILEERKVLNDCQDLAATLKSEVRACHAHRRCTCRRVHLTAAAACVVSITV